MPWLSKVLLKAQAGISMTADSAIALTRRDPFPPAPEHGVRWSRISPGSWPVPSWLLPNGSAAGPQPFCSSACLLQPGQNEDRGAACGEIQIPGLGKLLAHPFKSLKREETTLWLWMLSVPTSSSSVSRKVREAVVGCIPAHGRIAPMHLLVFPGLAMAPSVQTRGSCGLCFCHRT